MVDSMKTMVKSFREACQEQHFTFNAPLPENFPFTWYRVMRAEAPVYYDASLQAWSLFLYKDIQQALSNYTIFSSKISLDAQAEFRPELTTLIRTDPPYHRQLRALVSQVFSPRSIATLAPIVEQIVNNLLDPLLDQGRLDVMQDVAYPIPVMVISRMLGVPLSDHKHLKPLVDRVFEQRGDTLRGSASQPGVAELVDYFRQLIAQRRCEPQQDLTSDLIQAEIDGKHLSDDELIGFCLILYIAGYVTTTNLIGSAFLCFDMHPEAMQQIRTNTDLLPGALEEVLRYCSPAQSTIRLLVKDFEVGGQKLHTGESLVAWIGSANNDERAFDDPERFDITRNPNRHMAFGHGIHFCLGAPLARLEAPIAIRIMLERMRDISRLPGVTLEPVSLRGLYGVKNLPIAFTPA